MPVSHPQSLPVTGHQPSVNHSTTVRSVGELFVTAQRSGCEWTIHRFLYPYLCRLECCMCSSIFKLNFHWSGYSSMFITQQIVFVVFMPLIFQPFSFKLHQKFCLLCLLYTFLLIEKYRAPTVVSTNKLSVNLTKTTYWLCYRWGCIDIKKIILLVFLLFYLNITYICTIIMF